MWLSFAVTCLKVLLVSDFWLFVFHLVVLFLIANMSVKSWSVLPIQLFSTGRVLTNLTRLTTAKLREKSSWVLSVVIFNLCRILHELSCIWYLNSSSSLHFWNNSKATTQALKKEFYQIKHCYHLLADCWGESIFCPIT